MVTAVALGASAGLTDAASQVVKDAYAGLKTAARAAAVDLSGVERKPDSATQRAALPETLTDAGGVDDEVLAAAQAVTDAVAAHDPDAARVVGVNLRSRRPSSCRIGSVHLIGRRGQVADGVRLSGGLTVDEVRAGGPEGPTGPSPR